MTDPSGTRTDFTLLQYIFTRGGRTLEEKPHGNSKGKTFYPMQKSIKDEIKKLAQASNPKEVFHRPIEEKGGMENIPEATSRWLTTDGQAVPQPVVVRLLIV